MLKQFGGTRETQIFSGQQNYVPNLETLQLYDAYHSKLFGLTMHTL